MNVQLVAQCSGQFLGSAPLGSAMAHSGSGPITGSFGDMSMASGYGQAYGRPLNTYGIGSLGGCCGGPSGVLASVPVNPRPTIMYSPIADRLVHYPGARVAPPYLMPNVPPPPPPPSMMGSGLTSPYGLGTAPSHIPFMTSPPVIGAGNSGVLASGPVPAMSFASAVGPSIMGGPHAIPIMPPTQVTENENANTNININNEMGKHHSLIPNALMGLVRM